MSWADGGAWEAWASTLVSGIHVYCDTDGAEQRVLASAKRGSAMEADRFFLELLAESRGHHFGIEMSGSAPARVRTNIDDRGLLADAFVELLEGTEAAADVSAFSDDPPSSDFRHDVERWLAAVLVAPPPTPRSRRYPRLRDGV